MMKLCEALASLWQLTDRRERLIAIWLLVLLVVSSAFEMSGMLVLFSYIAGLSGHAGGGATNALRNLFERLFGSFGELEFAVYGGVFVLGAFAFKNLLAVAVDFLNTRFLMKLYARLAPQLLETFLRRPYQMLLHEGSAEPVRILNQMLPLFNASIGASMQALSDLVLIAVISLLLLAVDPILTVLATLMFVAAQVGVHYANRTVLARMGDEAVRLQRQSAAVLGESFGELLSIRLANALRFFVDSYSELIQGAALLGRRRRALSQLPRITNELVLAAGIVAAALYFGLSGRSITVEVPVLALFGFAGLRLTAAFSRLSVSLQSVNEKARDFALLMNAIRGALPGVGGRTPAPADDYLAGDRPLPAGAPARFSEALKVENVRFTYPAASKPAVRDVALTLRPGSFTAICGPTGSGKSTLLLIMMGLIRPDSGDVLCDGWPVFDHIRAWHGRIGYVGQRPFMSRRSIRENVAFGRPPEEIDDDKVWRALELAQIAGEVRELRGKLRARLGDGGIKMSGGQLQRLDLARAFYRSPQILFLDEATAALDNITERKVVGALHGESGVETVVCVAHRLSTIRDADVIHVMENGTITGSGSYDRLVGQHKVFSEMAERPEMTDVVA